MNSYLHLVDNCVVCLGENGGIRGNENLIDGHPVCDYCCAPETPISITVGTHLTVATYPKGRKVLVWDDEALKNEIEAAIAEWLLQEAHARELELAKLTETYKKKMEDTKLTNICIDSEINESLSKK